MTGGACLLLLLFAAVFQVFPLKLPGIVISAVMVGAPIIIYGIQPRRIVVSDDAIRLECPFRTKVIRRDTGMEVRRVRDYDTQFLVRKCGLNGVFGNWGIFGSKRWPRMHFHTKRGPKDWIMLRMGDGKNLCPLAGRLGGIPETVCVTILRAGACGGVWGRG